MDQERNGLNQRVKFFARKMRQLGCMPSKLVQLMRIKTGGLGAEPLAAYPLGDFCDFQQRYSHVSATRIKFRTFLEPCERIKLLRLESQLKK